LLEGVNIHRNFLRGLELHSVYASVSKAASG
jgi:hypothetical protein